MEAREELARQLPCEGTLRREALTARDMAYFYGYPSAYPEAQRDASDCESTLPPRAKSRVMTPTSGRVGRGSLHVGVREEGPSLTLRVPPVPALSEHAVGWIH
ncbi:hypothetical protein CB1_000287021 [Camelus ferus]|nr:hypothetical protein CB1_000287021 [Camelus ferus]